jgi:PAS domain S-box-containing protein
MESLPQDRLNRNRTQDRRARPAILIVDDRQENLLALERLLDQTGAVVVKAQNGNDALKACLNHEFALALLDVNMPEMNGYELAALMRGERNHSAVPIIFVTAAYGQKEQIFQGYSAGAVDYLVKPLQAEILLNKVKVFLDIHRRKQDITHLNAVLATRADEQAAANEELQAQSEELQAQSEELQAQSEELQAQNEALIDSMEELQAAEQELRAAHGRINAILEQMSDGFVSFDRDWRYTQINAAAAKMLQMAPEQLLGKTIWEMWPQAFDLPIGVNFRRSLQENISLQFETYYPAPLDRWFECRCHPTTEGLAIFFSDITERRQAALELQHGHDLLEAAQRLGKLGSWELDFSYGVLCWSEEVYRIFELDPARFKPSYENFLRAIHPDDHALVDQAYQQSLLDQKPYSIEHRLLFADGRIKWVREHCTSTFDLSGKPLRSMGMIQDITERKQAEAYLQAMNDNLERMVEQRTRELQETQKQFLHTEKLSAIGKLSASIAHEFNNPLQGILSTLRGLRKRAKMDAEDTELLDAAIGEGDRIKNLIRSLQDFNRPSSGRKVMMDLHHSLDPLLLLLKSDFNGKRISVRRDYMERIPQILAVPDQIKQVLLNLLTNAADACHQSGGVITVSTRQEDDRVAVSIKDTGVGIEASDLEQIFRPFYTTKAEVKGTGLGLSVSYGIIQNHQGEIRVKSLPGKGATFTVLLPIKGNGEEDAFANDR